ncbi:MAG: protein translocase subunit SecF, partial [Deltaproteobacteria bacterium]|nr:protein translocase subunit SecF [Deltaproteobacteria bacterium]
MSVFNRMYRGETNFDFVAASRKTLLVSGSLVVISILLMAVVRFNPSIDFTGGVIVVVPNTADASVEEVRADLRSVGYADARVQLTGEGEEQFIQVQTEALDPAEQDELVRAVVEAGGADIDEANVSAVGPTFGAEVTRRAIEALVVFLVVVSLFIAWRFEWKMAGAGLIALFHDLVIAGGIYAATGFPVTPSTIIAVLTILGYSLYDTVVVFDKVTENVAYADNRTTYTAIVNRSMNQVLMRSVNTSLTSLLPVGSLLVVGFLAIGAETLREFALALFIGIALGTYSSLFVAAPILARWKETEPEWERRRRRAERVSSGDDDHDDHVVEPEPVAPDFNSAAAATP